MIAVSACLIGLKCRYDGRCVPDEEITALMERGGVLPLCPEMLGGLDCPRSPAEIVGGDGADVLCGRARVMNSAGVDVTAQFVLGAQKALEMCREAKAELAVLKGRSPSCGLGSIYDGSFTRTLREGDGVTAALLKRHGIRVRSR